jgi:hypothetical protein
MLYTIVTVGCRCSASTSHIIVIVELGEQVTSKLILILIEILVFARPHKLTCYLFNNKIGMDFATEKYQ